MTSKIIDEVVQQPDAFTCQSACIAKVLGTQDVYAVRSDLEALGIPGDPRVMGLYLRDRVGQYEFIQNGSITQAVMALKAGFTIITHGWFSRSGHVITLVDFDETAGTKGSFVVDDPQGEFHFTQATYDTSVVGENLRYSTLGIYAYCVASWSKPDAEAYYRHGSFDPRHPGAWLHLVKN